MTRGELKELKGLAASMGLYDDKNPCKRAVILGKAIKTLGQAPCEDAISRQAALNAISRIGLCKCSTNEIQAIDECLRATEALSPVTPQPKTGHWIKYGIPRCGEQHYKCTSCGYYINFGQWGELYTKEFKYCPNCGLRMVEPHESEGKE